MAQNITKDLDCNFAQCNAYHIAFTIVPPTEGSENTIMSQCNHRKSLEHILYPYIFNVRNVLY